MTNLSINDQQVLSIETSDHGEILRIYQDRGDGLGERLVWERDIEPADSIVRIDASRMDVDLEQEEEDEDAVYAINISFTDGLDPFVGDTDGFEVSN